MIRLLEQESQANPGLIGYNLLGLSLNANRAQKRKEAASSSLGGDMTGWLFVYYQGLPLYTSSQRHISFNLSCKKQTNSRRLFS